MIDAAEIGRGALREETHRLIPPIRPGAIPGNHAGFAHPAVTGFRFDPEIRPVEGFPGLPKAN